MILRAARIVYDACIGYDACNVYARCHTDGCMCPKPKTWKYFHSAARVQSVLALLTLGGRLFRGMDLLTYMLEGWCRHADSLGNRESFPSPAMQWTSAGSGIEHAEGGGTPAGENMHGFQIWINVPSGVCVLTPVPVYFHSPTPRSRPH